MNVGSVMTSAAKITSPDATIEEVAKAMRDEDIGALPVGQDDRLVGMITDRDIATRVVAEGRSPGSTTVAEAMTKGVAYCFDDDPLEAAADVMARHQIRRLPVVNRERRLVGTLAIADLARSGDGLDRSAAHAIREVSKESTDSAGARA